MRDVIFELKERKNDFTTLYKVFFIKGSDGVFKKPTITKSKIQKIGHGNPIGLRVYDCKSYCGRYIYTTFIWMFEGLPDGVRAGAIRKNHHNFY